MLAVCEEALGRAFALAVPAYAAERRWADRVRARLCVLLEWVEREPQLALMCLVALASGEATARRRREALMRRFAGVVDEGRRAARSQPPPLTAEMVVEGAIAIVERQLIEGRPVASWELANRLMAIIVHLYLGSASATQELERQQLPLARSRVGTPASNRRERWPIRPTYRTMRVLDAIDAQPGRCNRDIAHAAGIGDEGQASKLLARLHRLELARNAAADTAGNPNAWTLTSDGEELLHAVKDAAAGPPLVNDAGVGAPGMDVLHRRSAERPPFRGRTFWTRDRLEASWFAALEAAPQTQEHGALYQVEVTIGASQAITHCVDDILRFVEDRTLQAADIRDMLLDRGQRSADAGYQWVEYALRATPWKRALLYLGDAPLRASRVAGGGAT